MLKPLKPLGADFPRDLAAAAKEVDRRRWQVRLTDEGGSPSLQQQEAMAEERMRAAVLEEPNVRALLESFPTPPSKSIEPERSLRHAQPR